MKLGVIGAGFAGQMFSLCSKKVLKGCEISLFEKFKKPEAGSKEKFNKKVGAGKKTLF
jgi:hypothetical protein